jgi:hypothetical protein
MLKASKLYERVFRFDGGCEPSLLPTPRAHAASNSFPLFNCLNASGLRKSFTIPVTECIVGSALTSPS